MEFISPPLKPTSRNFNGILLINHLLSLALKKRRMEFLLVLVIFFISFPIFTFQLNNDAAAILDLRKALKKPPATWVGDDPCGWGSGSGVQCEGSRVTRIQLGNMNLEGGPLPPSIATLSALTVLELMKNKLTGPLPSLAGMSSLQTLNLHSNSFASIPSGYFSGMTSLSFVSLDYNPFEAWRIPDSLKEASSLEHFSANGANVTGSIPDFFNTVVFPSLLDLHLAQNFLEGPIPGSFAGSSIQTLWLNGQQSGSKLNGTTEVVGNMTSLTALWLNLNSFTGSLPDFSGLSSLQNISLRDNRFTGRVPESLTGLPSLVTVNLTNNLLQGQAPKFSSKVSVDMVPGNNRFCSDNPSVSCGASVNALLDIAEGFMYPALLADSWIGNDPCSPDVPWKGVVCSGGNITVINFINFGLQGTLSPSFSLIPSLQKILLSNNSLSGSIPDSLTNLSRLTVLDLSNNRLHGPVPQFDKNLQIELQGNPDINKTSGFDETTPRDGESGSAMGGPGTVVGKGSKSSAMKVVGLVIAAVCLLLLLAFGYLCLRSRKKKASAKVQNRNVVVFHPRDSSDEAVKVTVAGSSASLSSGNPNPSQSSDVHVVESGNMVISIQVLRSVTNDFSERNILGQGGFGTVYRGELHDGTKIAVKRMGSGMVSDKGLSEFLSEIAVLTKVRHRHLVALLGYCLDGNEKLLVYEYMPQGTLSRFLFNSEEERLKPLEWTRRLIIALDVARGVEYLHGLAQQTFIHRDLKPSNILLGDDMRAKVSDFGLVRLAPEGGKASIATRLAGTFGYLAPEYAVTGRVTTKIDVFSFGVILMEIISGRRALDESRPEESMHLVTWFRRMVVNKETFREVIDRTIDLTEETMGSVMTVAELAGHCTAREPYQRPDMGHAVNVLSSLVEMWKPTEVDVDDVYGIDFDMTLPQALKKWQAFEGDSYMGSNENTHTSIPNRPSGFADSFTSNDAR